AAVLAADRIGNAVAMPYHHTILPLSSRRDKETEVRWGIADFRRRFGREPEGMWLPETAVDDETLDVLAAQGIRFTILAPHQVEEPPPAGLPGKYTTAGGRSIALCIYDGPISHDIAFGPLVTDAERWRADCGCRVHEGTSQAWRAPLRAALDDLAAALHRRFETEAAEYFPDPWGARDAYAAVGLPSHLPVRARELLEMERNALRMF